MAGFQISQLSTSPPKQNTSNLNLVNLFRLHRMIIAAGSQYFHEIFKKYDNVILPIVNIPKPYNQAYEAHSDDSAIRVFKYFYSGQVI